MQPSVSVVVPVYNTEKYLQRCIDSLLNQTLTDLEIVAVDDGSTDNCGKMLDEYHAKYPEKVKVVHKENGGQASARNLAFTVCTGEYIGFLDSDDFVRPEMFGKMYAEAVEYGADYVACGYTDITYEDGQEIVLKEYVASKPAKCTEDMFVGALVCPFLHLYRRELIQENHIVFPEGVIYEDTAFYLNLIPYVKKIAVIEEALAVRIRHSNSTTSTFKKEKVANIIPVIQYAVDYYKKIGKYEQYRLPLEYFCVKVLLCSSMQRVSRVKAFRDARELQKRTLEYIGQTFPEYRKNPYFRSGVTNLYMRSFNQVTSWAYLAAFRIANKFKREYT